MARTIVRRSEFARAAQLFKRGYQDVEIAQKLGVHRNTVQRWRRRLGCAERVDRTVVQTVMKRVRRTKAMARRPFLQALINRLNEELARCPA